MEVTVAICTRGRWLLLREAIDSLAVQEVPEGVAWEVVVVDNGPEPPPAQIREGLDHVPLRVVREPRPGLSHARNRAVREASGAFILWTDDDVYVDRNWIADYAAAFRRRPEASLFGGPIRAHFEAEPPRWLQRTLPRMGGVFALRDLGNEAIQLTPERLPFGANYAIRTSVQRDFPYDVDLGRRGTGLGLGREETEVMTRILADGHIGWWVPGAGVRHRIGDDRFDVRYFRSYFVTEGEYIYRRDGPDGPWFVPRLLARILLAGTRYMRRPLAGPERWMHDLMTASNAWGQLRAHLRSGRGAPPGTAGP